MTNKEQFIKLAENSLKYTEKSLNNQINGMVDRLESLLKEVKNIAESDFYKRSYYLMKNREIILDNLAQVRSLLLSTLLLLDEENKDGKQFDYVNSPRLSDSFDAANRTI